MKKRSLLIGIWIISILISCTISLESNAKENVIIQGFEQLNKDEQSITLNKEEKYPLTALTDKMPNTLTILTEDGKEKIDVEWVCVGEDYENSDAYYFQFSPQWDESKYKLSDNLCLIQDAPYISVFLYDEQLTKDRAVTSNANETTIYNFLKNEMGLNTAAACGVLANIYHESSFNPSATGDSGTSYGICQWHNSRWDAMKTWCTNNGYDWRNLTGQLYYLKFELSQNNSAYLWNGKTIYNYISSVENTAQGAYNAGHYWCYYFEVPANKETVSVTRGNLAKNTYWPAYAGTVDQAPVGYLDEATGGVNKIYVKGWAYDPDSTGSSLYIHIYVDGKHVATTTANKLREDVHNSRGCGKYHGYATTFTYKVSSTGTHKVETYALNTNTSGVNTRLTNSPKTVTVTADTTNPTITNVKITNKSCTGFTVSCTVTDNAGIDRVQFPVWTRYNGQDDLDPDWWSSGKSAGTKNGNVYSFRVNKSDHNDEIGEYAIDIYAFDTAGNKTMVSAPSTEMGVHDWDSGNVIKKATCTKNGGITYTCTACGKTKESTIYKASNVKLSTASYVYNGKKKSPTVVIKNSEGNTISSSNYTISKPTGRKNVGKYIYKITFKNRYSGTKTLTLTIKPKGTSISGLTKASKAFTVKWKKQSAKMSTSRITGYQIKYSTSEKFTNAKTKTVSGYKNVSKKITGLKSKKTYYVKVRTYKTMKYNGESVKIYSGWSNVKSVKTK